MAVILNVKERDRILSSLDAVQANFLQLHLKRSKKTVFANHMARDKGLVFPEDVPSEEIEMLLDEWILEDYIDNGFVNPETPCECGRPLRYQYIVKHKGTGTVRRFGITHFEEHTGIPPNLIKVIVSGFNFIDYELDELLYKIDTGWQLQDELSYIPEEYSFPKDMQLHVDANVPLLNRQVKRLKLAYLAALEEEQLLRRQMEVEVKSKQNNRVNEEQDPWQETFFENQELPAIDIGHKNFVIAEYRDVIMKYVDQGISSARVMCELLIKEHGASRERYSTSKPKIYPSVCMHLETLVKQGNIGLIRTKNTEDRYYGKASTPIEV
ncbi:DUF3895 domain-containing protein [Fictibacillus sp. 7GRE50]|uniref:DUF3895 domain-containing protein n=1 Tax=Fictibacillus sp. 7GRE50 TaxID=2745878 RepID=UPI0018CEBAB0|nr:DUF3895 domain-containing protein [Fictibacillus sp. 7GRE50]MBH0167166.1 DUF3895 domain-containing protein [Fictibacillus sp. 7GRE50]